MALYTLKKINKSLIRSSEQNLDQFFVAVACSIDEEGIAHHAGLIINCDEGCYLFHFTGDEVLLEADNIHELEWYFHKSLDIIDSELCGAFLGHCKKTLENAIPRYGFFYNGSYYKDGEYYTNSPIPEFMTCVGFCINVVKGFIEEDEYFNYSDWNNQELNLYISDEEYIGNLIKKIQQINPDVNVSSISENIRRITPAEYLASAFVNKLPIRKADVDSIIDLVVKAIKEKRIQA